MLPLPGFDDLGRKVFLYRMGCFPPDKVKVEDLEKASGMVAEVLAYEEPLIFVTGVVVVVDFEGYSLGHLTHRPLSFMKKQAKYFQVLTIDWNIFMFVCNILLCLTNETYLYIIFKGCRSGKPQKYQFHKNPERL